MTDVEYGSDVVVDVLRRLGVDYATVNPGASFRGMHDSLVHGGGPEVIMTLFEGVNVAIAHGYGKAAGKPMAAFVHDLVGLQHASMGIFNAWADQVPVVVVGGSGPADSAGRRPWIDWIHTVRWQGLQVRDYTKWDDEPTSVEALADSLVRAHRYATATPPGPTYVAVDAGLQERVAPALDLERISPRQPMTVTAPDEELDEVADRLCQAESPVILTDFTGRNEAAYLALIDLAETVAASVVDLGARHNFPATHWADATNDRVGVLADADLVLALDVRDVRFATSELLHAEHSFRSLLPADATVISIGTNDLQPTGFIDREGVFWGELSLSADTGVALPALADKVRRLVSGAHDDRRRALQQRGPVGGDLGPLQRDGVITPTGLASRLWDVVQPEPWLLANGSLRGAVRRTWRLDRWNCYLGTSGGGGLGYGIGAGIGAGLAHRDDDTLVVNLQNDGDLLYTASGLWTAAHHRIPVLTVVANNRTYGQDRMHQENIAEHRGRDASKVSVGIDIDDPEVDHAKMAEAQGVEGFGRVDDPDELPEVLERAARLVRDERRPVLVDVGITR